MGNSSISVSGDHFSLGSSSYRSFCNQSESQVETYVSPIPDEKAWVVDAMTLNALANGRRRSEIHALSIYESCLRIADDRTPVTLLNDPSFLAENQVLVQLLSLPCLPLQILRQCPWKNFVRYWYWLIHTVISACPYVQNIILSDCLILGEWKDDKLQTGSALCQFVLDIEGGKIHKTVPERFEEIRQKIREILPVDVNKWPPIQLGNDCPDIIVSSLCFEAACLEVPDYKKIVQNVGRLMTPGCHLVVIGVLDQTFYRVGNFRFSCLKISESDLKAVYATNGFDIKSWKEYIPPPRNAEEAEFSDFQKAFVMHAVKVK
ncbi:unnamed protein product [Mytilus edulis]|uniref:Uncharacterized protein n=1 Tax=Mytilus edulis TaxID=6550 RepID=A0A8S3Q975_MYTED|nr:unnamed protein product [Mytilus edulis]